MEPLMATQAKPFNEDMLLTPPAMMYGKDGGVRDWSGTPGK